MNSPLTTRAALLQVLRPAPGYGSDLIRRFQASTRRFRLAPGRVYPVLKELQAEGLVEAVRLAPKGRRGGRTRVYYALTAKGRAASTVDRDFILALALLSPSLPASPEEHGRMAERLLEAEAVSASGTALASARR